MRRLFFIIIITALYLSNVLGDEPMKFSDSKTFFQTASFYDPLLAIDVDFIVVHSGAERIKSWLNAGYPVGRMFFADSDDGRDYTSGHWDGVNRIDDAEHNAAGEVIECAGVRPYMLPTDKWIEYLKGKADASIDAGVTAIFPEEPLAHIFSGYEASFKPLWEQRYGMSWQPQNESAYATFLTAQLKNELYIKLERELLLHTKQRAKELGKEIAFVVPIHSLYSNMASQLVAPLGTSGEIGDIDGYVGQIWTGPVNWALANYDGEGSFFSSAYALYDYFVQLAVKTDKKLWLLVDPVEDDPNHKWEEFKRWYEYCVVAMLLMKDIDSYEIMPWPDRIFLAGHSTGGATPAPQSYRRQLLSVTQVLQDIPLGGRNLLANGGDNNSPKIAVAVSDTLMWQSGVRERITGVYGQMMPLIRRGVAVSSFPIERYGDTEYMNGFDIIVLSYQYQIPLKPELHDALKEWVAQGGTLILLGEKPNALAAVEDFWWHRHGYDCPLKHLLSTMGYANQSVWESGKGYVVYDKISPAEFAKSKSACEKYIDMITLASKRIDRELLMPGYFYMERGDYIIAQAETAPLKISRSVIDVFNMDSQIKDGIELQPGQCGLYKDATRFMAASAPSVMHTTHRLVSSRYDDETLTLSVKGPAQTNAKVWIFTGENKADSVSVSCADGNVLEFARGGQGKILTITFSNLPQGVNIVVKFKSDTGN